MKKLIPLLNAWTMAVPLRKVFQAAWAQAVGASWFLALAAQIKVPCYPVPMTMQTFAIMLVALWAPHRVAIGAVLLYLAQGAAGMPLFPSGAGPTLGYLVGFVLMAGVIAAWTERYPASGFWARLGFVFIGQLFLFVPGLAWLAHLIGWQAALQAGLYPFAISDLVKAILAVYLSVFMQGRKW